MARTFRLFQCAHKPSAVLPSGVNVCRMHLRTWRKHGLITDTSLSHSHERDIVKYLSSATTTKDNRWYTRDIMWREACAFQVNNLSDLTDDQYMECLQEVHKYWQQHRTQRIERQLVAGSGPQSCTDRGEASEAYIGGELAVFKFFDNRIFQEELRGISAVLTPSACSEKDFMLALRYTNNRMMNWVACRTFPVNE